jgi:hypothetical protein
MTKGKTNKKEVCCDSDSDDDIDDLILDCVNEVAASDQQSNFAKLHSRLTKAGSVKEIKLKSAVNHTWKGGMRG